MTHALFDTLADYKAGLTEQVHLLHGLLRAAQDQFAASTSGVAHELAKASEERARIMSTLMALEHDQRGHRDTLHRHLDAVRLLDGFSEVSALHRVAEECVGRIHEQDASTRERLAREQALRTATAHTLDAGETTLAAYRKVLTSGGERSALVDQHG